MVASRIGISKILLFTVFVAAIALLVVVSTASDEDSSADTVIVDGYFTYTSYIEGTATLTGFSGEAVDNVSVPISVVDKSSGLSYTVDAIGDSVFASKSNIKTVTIGNTIMSIGYRAFSGCSGLSTVTLGSNVESIRPYAFEYCTSLTSIAIPSKVCDVGDYAFRGCSTLISVTLPVNNSFAEINKGTFEECTRLASISIPATVIEIGGYAFFKCSSLSSVIIPDESHLKSIGEKAFGRCSLLEKVDFKSNLTAVGANSFEYCTSLNEVIFPKRFSTIGNLAFYHCSSLKSVTIPKSVSNIGYGAFAFCKLLNNISVESGNTSFKTVETVLVDYGYTRIIQCPNNKETIFIPNTVMTIGAYAFSGCDQLKEISIPSSVVDIGDYAFSYCNSLKTVSISKNVDTIGTNVFFVCDSLESIVVDSANPNYYSSYEGILYSRDLSKLIKCPDTMSSVCYISSQVKYIEEAAFFNCKNIPKFEVDIGSTSYVADSSGVLYTYGFIDLCAYPCGSTVQSYTINQNIIQISPYAFSSCTHLVNLSISTSNKSYSTAEGVLYSYDQKTLVYYPSGRTSDSFALISTVKAVNSYAFFNCQSLRNLGFTYGLIDYAPESVSVGTFGHDVEINLRGPTGYVFPSYAFNKYTDVPHPTEDKPFISTEVLLVIAIIVAVVVVAAIYFKRKYSY